MSTRALRWLYPMAALAVISMAVNIPLAQDDDDFVKEMRKKNNPDADKPKPKPADTKDPQAQPKEPEAVAPEGGIVLTGKRILLPEICEGSWCNGPHRLLAGESAQAAGVTLSLDDKQLTVKGYSKDSKSARKAQPYKPGTFKLAADESTPLPESTFKVRELAKGIDLELSGADGNGMAVIRVEETWRGVVWGVLSAWEFKLEKDKLTVVDADLDGKLSTGDRMVYGDRGIWMPWHSVTSSGDTIYHEVTPANSYQLTALTLKMEPRGSDSAIWDKWQQVRMDHGVPPGLFSAELQTNAVKHANYCKQNNHRGHDQDPNKPGYTKEGHDAGMSCCIHYVGSGKAEAAMWDFLGSLYHRVQLIDPRTVVLQVGGNDYAFLMGTNSDARLPGDSRVLETGQMYPAPGARVPYGDYRPENPTHPILRQSKKPGIPVVVRLDDYSPSFSDVDCKLYQVSGDVRTGKRGAEVSCHLSHKGQDAPEGFPEMWSQIALTPHAPLAKGTYEAEYRFTASGKQHHYHWRFTVG